MPYTLFPSASLGSTLPLGRKRGGYFQTTTDPIENEKSKFINLILTKKGERVSNPTFGCDLWKLLFEQKDGDTLQELAQQYVQEAVNAFMPYLQLEEVSITNAETFDTDQNINLYVRYRFSNLPTNINTEIQVLLGTAPDGGISVSGGVISRVNLPSNVPNTTSNVPGALGALRGRYTGRNVGDYDR